jgi:hypothetical protein
MYANSRKQRHPLPRSPLHQSFSAVSPTRSSPSPRAIGTPLRVAALRHQLSEGALPRQHGRLHEATTPEPRGTMSDRRPNLPPYPRRVNSELVFNDEYFRQQLENSSSSGRSSSATEAAVNNIPSPLEKFEQQVEWQVAWMRGHSGPGSTSNEFQLDFLLRKRAERGLRDGTLKPVSGPPPKVIPPAPARLEIQIPASMQNLRDNPPGLAHHSESFRRRRQQHAHGITHAGGSSTMGLPPPPLMPSSPFAPGHQFSPINQFTPAGCPHAAPPFLPAIPIAPAPPYMAPPFLPGITVAPVVPHHIASQFSNSSPAAPAGPPKVARQLSHAFPSAPAAPPQVTRQLSHASSAAPAGPPQVPRQLSHAFPAAPPQVARQLSPAFSAALPQVARQLSPAFSAAPPQVARQLSPAFSAAPVSPHHAVRQFPPRQTTPVGHMATGSPVSRSASSFSDMMSSTSSRTYVNGQNLGMDGPRAMMPAESLRMQRSRPLSMPQGSSSYERNNEYMASVAYGQGRPTQRPTPPPAVGHGRPHSSEQQTRVRNASRPFFEGAAPLPARQLPHWQRNQENSEEAAMSVLQHEMALVRVGEESEESEEEDDEVMNSTPPQENMMLERYLREEE